MTSAATAAGLESAREFFGGRHVVKVVDVAAFFDVTPSHVYAHAAELGGRKVGGAWRFLVEDVLAATSCPAGRGSEVAETRMVEPKRASRRRPGSGREVDLLPIRGRIYE